MSKWWLIAAAGGIGIAVVAVTRLLFSALTGHPVEFSPDVEPVNVAIVASLYLLLAALDERRLLPWFVGLTLTLLLWGYALHNGVTYQWNADGSGVNIGLGILILFSPFYISAAVLIARALVPESRQIR